MFDINADDGSVQKIKTRSLDTYGQDNEPDLPVHEYDKPKMQSLHRRLLDQYLTEVERQGPNRQEQAEDEEFYDNNQWRDEDKEELEARGQVPLVYNIIATSIDWVTGSEKRARMDWKILARRKEGNKAAERKTQLLKYLNDVNRTQFTVSRAFEDAVKVGIGWVEDGWKGDDDGDEPLFTRYVSWRNVWPDSTAKELDYSDGRYQFRADWFDLDLAQAMFADRAGLLDRSAEDTFDAVGIDMYGDEVMDAPELDNVYAGLNSRRPDTNGFTRRRVRLIECWYRMPVKASKLKGGQFSGEFFDEYSPGHREELENARTEVNEASSMRMYVCIMTAAGILYNGVSPYRHNKYPLTPIIGYKRGKDGQPYGMVRRMKGIQEDINKRASKALHILSTNKVIMDEGAIGDDMSADELLEEVSRPDSIITVKTGKRFEINSERELSQYHMELMQRNIQLLQSSSGVTNENLGRQTNAASGIAIQRRQDQGALATMRFFDNLAFFQQVRGEKILVNVEQFMSDEKQFRITNMRGQPEYVTINNGEADNDIVRTKADFVITETDFQATVRAAQAMELMQLMSTWPPEIALTILDLVVESTDVPNRDEIVSRIRKVTGQRDPDQTELSPEEQQAMAAAQQMNAQQQAMAQAQLRKLMADGDKSAAEARRIAAQLVGTNIDAQNKAIMTAREAVATPQIIDMADHMMTEAGFIGQSDMDAAQAAAMQQQQAAAEQDAAMQQQAAQQEQQFAGEQPSMPQDPAQMPEQIPTSPAQG